MRQLQWLGGETRKKGPAEVVGTCFFEGHGSLSWHHQSRSQYGEGVPISEAGDMESPVPPCCPNQKIERTVWKVATATGVPGEPSQRSTNPLLSGML